MAVKCTYKSCSQKFKTHAQMTAHKIRVPQHCYCDRCDVDCEDDEEFFIHQLGSPAHICCPICGAEFKSESGRDRHVEDSHKADQRLSCAGCATIFGSPAVLMRHIETGKCKIITKTDFQIQRVEKQLEKDVAAAPDDPFSPHCPISGLDVRSGIRHTVDLLKDDYMNGVHSSARGSKVNGPLRNVTNVTTGASVASRANRPKFDQNDKIEEDMGSLKLNQNSGHENKINKAEIPSPSNVPQSDRYTRVNGWLGALEAGMPPQQSNTAEIISQGNDEDTAAKDASSVDRVGANSTGQGCDSLASESWARALQDPDPNAQYKHVKTAPSQLIESYNLDVARFWDDMHQKYVCPTQECHLSFDKAAGFREHLHRGAHAGSDVVCPSCLKRFKSVHAWVAHCESNNRKCQIKHSKNANSVMRDITGGMLGVAGYTEDKSVKFVAPKIQEWSGP